MDIVVLFARLGLAAVFAVAAFAKIAAPAETRATLTAFGLVERLARPFAFVLPAVEAAIAVTLLFTATAQAAAAAAAALLLVFSGAVALNLARGNRPDCNCFGAVHSKPIGPATLVRNLALATVAVFVAGAGPGASAFAWLGRLSTTELVLTLTVALLAVALVALTAFVLSIFRRHGALLLRIDALESGRPQPVPVQPGLAVGTPAPDFVLEGLDGETMTLAALRSHGRPVLLLFTDPQCGPCNALLPDLGQWQREHERTLTIGVVSRRGAEANRPKAKEHGLVNVLLQAEDEVAQAFGVTGTPAAVLVGENGAVASAPVFGVDAIRALVQTAAFRPAVPGDVAPDFALVDAEGRERTLAEFRGNDLLLLFWNPGCSFCQAMAEDLQRLDESAGTPGVPDLLVLTAAAGAPDLRSPVLLDPGMAAAARFGANGTPMAVRIDAEGRVSSHVAAGSEQVLALVPALASAS